MDSILTVTDEADDFDLTTKEDVKTELKITGTDSDSWLDAKVTRVSILIADECNRIFAEQDYSETFRLLGDTPQMLPLSQYPVSEVLVTEDDAAAPLDDSEIEIDEAVGLIYRLCNGERIAWCCRKAVVTYTAGYADDAIPVALQDAAITAMKGMWFARTRDPNLMSQSSPQAGDQRWWVGNPSGEPNTLPAEIMPTLDPYRRRLVG